jgi:hypothetical protein
LDCSSRPRSIRAVTPHHRISRSAPYNEISQMNLLYSLADAFIMTFGITPPRPENRKVAAIFIGSVLLLTIGGVLALFIAVILQLLGHGPAA